MATAAVLAALSAAASWAIASVAISRLMSRGRVTPAAANLFKNGLAAASFFVATMVTGGRWPVGEAWGWLFLSGFLGFAVADTLYFAAFRRCGVQTAATIVLMNVPIATLLAVPIAGDEIRTQVLPFMGVVLVGVLLVILDSRRAVKASKTIKQDPGEDPGGYALGILLALGAALAIGTAVPIGRGGFSDVGVCPGAFIRLTAGALGAFPLAAISGFRRGTTPSEEVSKLIQPLFVAPSPASVWGKGALTGVGCAIAGLVTYHYALRELPPGISAVLFSTTPLFTLPLAFVIGQRVGIFGFLGAMVGFTGVAGILLEGEGRNRFNKVTPVVAIVSFPSPLGARFPTFLEETDFGPSMRAAAGSVAQGGLPALLTFVEAGAPGAEDDGLLLMGTGRAGEPLRRPTLEASDVLPAVPPRLEVSSANLPRGIRLASGAILLAVPQKLGPDPLALGVKVYLEDDGPPARALGWLHGDVAAVEHAYVAAVPGVGGSALLAWLDGRETERSEDRIPGAAQATALYARMIASDGTFGDEVLLDERVSGSSPTDAVLLDSGAGLIAYRDRGVDDLLNIAVIRRGKKGSWGEPIELFDDGWRIAGQPVHGPAMAADGEEVAVAWYTKLDEGVTPAVRVAFSKDGGESFGEVATVVRGRTEGRVGLCSIGDGAFVLCHLAFTEGGDVATWKVGLVARGAAPSVFVPVADVARTRKSGRLDLVEGEGATVWATWTEPEGIRVGRIDIGLLEKEVLAGPGELEGTGAGADGDSYGSGAVQSPPR